MKNPLIFPSVVRRPGPPHPSRPAGTSLSAGRLLRHAARSALAALCALLLLPALAPSSTPRAEAVVYGLPAADSPWAVSIRTYGQPEINPCSGSLIDPMWVLTASHCSYNDDPRTWVLGFGNLAPHAGNPVYGSAGAGDVILPTAVHRHPYGADVAMLRMPFPMPIVPLARAAHDPPPGSPVDFFGFGQFQPGGDYSPVLLGGQTTVVGYRPEHGRAMVDNHAHRGGFSLGDSGGPIIAGGHLVGVHAGSWHHDRWIDGTNRGWYTSVPSINWWINDVIHHH